jgi:hypothetical protein
MWYIVYLMMLFVTQIPSKFLNVVMEKAGEDQLDRSCEK